MIKKYFVLLILCINIISCNDNELKLNEKLDNFDFESFPAKEKLSFKELNRIKGNPMQSCSYDSVLIINELGNYDGFSIYSKETGSFFNSDLPIGKGPNEVIASFAHGVIKDSVFWSFELETSKVRFYLISDIINQKKARIFKTVNFDFINSIYQIYPLSLDTFLITGSPSYKSKLTIMNDNGIILDSIGVFCNLTLSNYTFLKGAYKYLLEIKPDNKRVVFSYYHTDVIEIYGLDGTLIKSLQGPDNFDVEPHPTQKNMNEYFLPTKDTKETFIEIKTSNKYIYALYDGKSFDKPEPLGEWLFVFDWDGNPIKSFELPEGINVFELDEERNKIYAVSLNTGNLIYATIVI